MLSLFLFLFLCLYFLIYSPYYDEKKEAVLQLTYPTYNYDNKVISQPLYTDGPEYQLYYRMRRMNG